MIPYGRQDITEEDIIEVEKVLRSDFLTQGPCVPSFEKSVANYCGAKYAVAVNSATSALHVACLALDLGPGDILWTSPNTFVASANCALYCGASVDFVDIDPKTYNMSTESLSEKLSLAEKLGKLPKVVIPVHFAGQPCDMYKIHKLSKKYGFKIIEDASHALGSSYEKIKVGSCLYSDITIFSFHPVKIITTAEGGMSVTNDLDLYDKMKSLRINGIINDKKLMEIQPENEIWNYQQIKLGYNFKMNDIQAALGLSQIKRLDDFIIRRHKIANNYFKKLKNLKIILPFQSPGNYSSYHLFPICIYRRECNKTQKEIYEILRKNHIEANIHYIPVYLHPYYKALKFKRGYCPNAETYFKSTISIPMYYGLSYENQDKVIKIILNELK